METERAQWKLLLSAVRVKFGSASLFATGSAVASNRKCSGKALHRRHCRWVEGDRC